MRSEAKELSSTADKDQGQLHKARVIASEKMVHLWDEGKERYIVRRQLGQLLSDAGPGSLKSTTCGNK